MTNEEMKVYSVTIEAYDIKKHPGGDIPKWMVTVVTNKGEFVKYHCYKNSLRELINYNLNWLEPRND